MISQVLAGEKSDIRHAAYPFLSSKNSHSLNAVIFNSISKLTFFCFQYPLGSVEVKLFTNSGILH